MRILFAFVGGSGHAEPLVPLARAAEHAGHTVAFTGRPGVVEYLDFDVFPTGTARPRARVPLLPVDRGREERVLRDGFAGSLARERGGAVRTLCEEWRPDLVVCDEVDFGSMIASERLGLPYATVLVVAPGFVRRQVVGETLNAVRAEHGLPVDPELAMPARHLALSPFPPTYRAAEHPFRALAPRPQEPATTVYVTLGTEFPLESGDLFARLLAGVAELPVDVVATIGRDLDPVELGPLPANVGVERYVPQAELLPRCLAVVSHGGSGTVLASLAHGLPQVVLPLGADQPWNGDRLEALGLGLVLDGLTATPADVREAVAAVLAEPSFRHAAEVLRDELAALPGPEQAVTLLEQLVA